MTGRVRVWVGAVVTVGAVAGLGFYFAAVGLDKADKMASVIGGLVAVVGLAVAVYGLAAPPGGGRRVSQRARASGRGRVTQIGGDQNTTGGAPGHVVQRGTAADDGSITQVGGDQHRPGRR